MAAVTIVAGAITAWTVYRDRQLRRENASLRLRIEQSVANSVAALKKFDEMADAHYGEGSIPEHLMNVRNDLEAGYRLLTEALDEF